jgi:hypothetical protein
MTAQMNDSFRFQEHDYSIAGISEGELFDPTLLALAPGSGGVCTACYRGYLATFAVKQDRLVLDQLRINLEDPDLGGPAPPLVNGKSASRPDEEFFFNFEYLDLDYHLEYSGGVLLADGFIEELYVHMGFHPAWKYTTVKELTFEHGQLRQVKDVSATMAEFREDIVNRQSSRAQSDRMPSDEEIKNFIERAFDRRHRL